jgi:hypothetical protein
MARVTRTTFWSDLASLLPISASETRRPGVATRSPALRSRSDRLPTDVASAIFCAAIESTSIVTALTTEGLSVRSSAVWPTARTRMLRSTTSV